MYKSILQNKFVGFFLITALAIVFFSFGANISRAQTASLAEMQAMIDSLLRQVSLLQAQMKTVGVPASSATVGGGNPLWFATSSETKQIPQGDEKRVGYVTYKAQSEEAYLNSVTARFIPINNRNAKPWDSFDEILPIVNGSAYDSLSVADPNLWKRVRLSTGHIAYDVTVYQGNQRIPAFTTHDTGIGLDVSDQAPIGQIWDIVLPKGAVNIWTQGRGHQYYGNNQRLGKVEIVKSSEEPIKSDESEIVVEFLKGSTDSSTGQFSIMFEVTADDSDFIVSKNQDAAITIVGKDGADAGNKVSMATVVESNAKSDETGKYFVVSEGETELFAIKSVVYALNPKTGEYQMRMSDLFAYPVQAGGMSKVLQEEGRNVDYFKTAFAKISGTSAEVIEPKTKARITSLDQNGGNLVVQGTARGVKTVGFAVGGSSGDKIFGSGQIPVIGEVWSYKSPTKLDLVAGQKYDVILYVDNKEADRASFIATSVTATSTQKTPTAKITSSLSVTAGEKFTLSGTATGVNVVIVDITYPRGASIKTAVPVSNSTWRIEYPSGLPTAGSYEVVIRANSQAGDILTKGSIQVSASTVANVAPKFNKMSCDNPPKTGLSAGALACYGIWDYGNDFGDDAYMCGADGTIGYHYSNFGTGCKISTKACTSGNAIANRTFNLSNADDLSRVKANLGVSEGVLKAGLARVWEYVCTAGEVSTSTTSITSTSSTTNATSTPRRAPAVRSVYETSRTGTNYQTIAGSVTTPVCVDINRNLHRGAEASAVLDLQKFLNGKGLLSSDAITAFYGDLTVAAVKAYQRSVGLPETGMVYEMTRKSIMSDTCI